MIKVHILQVNSKYATEVARLKRDVTAGFTKDNWKTLKGAKAGDIAVWYVAGGPQVYAVWGWVSGVPHRVKPGEPFGPYQGPVAGMQWLPEEIDARMVRDLIGVDGGHEGPRTVPDEKAVAFLQLVGLLPQ